MFYLNFIGDVLEINEIEIILIMKIVKEWF